MGRNTATFKPTSSITQRHSSARLTQRHSDAVALGVQQSSDLREVAVETPVVLVHGALQKKGVLGVYNPRYALLRALHEHAGLLGVHVIPHALVRLVARVLRACVEYKIGVDESHQRIYCKVKKQRQNHI